MKQTTLKSLRVRCCVFYQNKPDLSLVQKKNFLNKFSVQEMNRAQVPSENVTSKYFEMLTCKQKKELYSRFKVLQHVSHMISISKFQANCHHYGSQNEISGSRSTSTCLTTHLTPFFVDAILDKGSVADTKSQVAK